MQIQFYKNKNLKEILDQYICKLHWIGGAQTEVLWWMLRFKFATD